MKAACLYLLAIAALSMYACNNTATGETPTAKSSKLEHISWMSGAWQMSVPTGIMSEYWQPLSDSEWQGVGMMISKTGDTLFKEALKLVNVGDTLWYKPIIATQNDGKEVSFKEKELSDKRVVFENLQHDFPQRIVYEKLSDTTMLAYIEGMKDGKMIREDFNYTKTSTK